MTIDQSQAFILTCFQSVPVLGREIQAAETGSEIGGRTANTTTTADTAETTSMGGPRTSGTRIERGEKMTREA